LLKELEKELKDTYLPREKQALEHYVNDFRSYLGHKQNESLKLKYKGKKVNPELIMTSITPFGQDGPYRNYKASDIGIMAMSGSMYLLGDPDRPPVQVSLPQSYVAASTYAAEGTMVAMYGRGNSASAVFSLMKWTTAMDCAEWSITLNVARNPHAGHGQ
jgi:crotonobetainyl-CoA:carnitine CoA-transferase CaiB-like acyl-CoA transferase